MMQIDIILFFLTASLLLYALLGGADFGAGIVEILVEAKERPRFAKITKKALGPVWEANHMWLILAIVILFNGFPKIYSTLSIYLHIPLTLMLLGIICRGCAFTFRHYDAIEDESNKIYSQVFQLSSLITPMTLGMMAGALTQGQFLLPTEGSYYQVYIAPWFNFFTLSLGLFTVALFGFLATIYLVGEAQHPSIAQIYRKLGKVFALVSTGLGLVVMVSGTVDETPLYQAFTGSAKSLTSLATATLLLIPLGYFLNINSRIRIRIVAGAIVSCIFFGWFALIFPNVVIYKNQVAPLGFYSHPAPDATLEYLTAALVYGSIIIFPALGILFKVFKGKNEGG